MKKSLFICALFLLGIALQVVFSFSASAQNVAITDSNTYIPHNSAMLDVQSRTKGFLAPRVTTAQRNAIAGPANGLLVYDITIGAYYYYTGTLWTNITSGNANNVWSKNANAVFLSDTAYKVGIGVQDPKGKLVVRGNSDMSDTTVLFEVKDKNGNTVFAVYPTGAVLYVKEGAKGNAGGFAVNARNTAKADSGLIMFIAPDSARIYVKEDAKGNAGGFAVNARNTAKGSNLSFLRVTSDSTRIYTGDTLKGFGVKNLGATGKKSYMNLTPNNYFIGHESGNSNLSGMYNSCMGYQTAFSNNSGSFNTFLGYRAGYSNTTGFKNTFLGYKAGASNTTGSRNVFVGDSCGVTNSTGLFNVFVGNLCGKSNTTGMANVFLGISAGLNNTTGIANVFLGYVAGRDNGAGTYNTYLGPLAGSFKTGGDNNISIGVLAGSFFAGSNNVCIGYNAGMTEAGSNKLYIANNSTTPLIYGDFATPKVGINTGTPSAVLDVYTSGTTGDAGIGVTSGLTGGKHLTINQGQAGKLNFTEPLAYDLLTMDFNTRNVGIGNTSPSYKLDVFGRVRFQSNGSETSGAWFTTIAGADRAFVGMSDDNNFGFYGGGGIGWGFFFNVISGDVRIPRAYTAGVGATNRDLFVDNTGLIGYVSSSMRYKKNITDMENVDWLYELRPVNYVYKADVTNRKEYGLIAEEVEKINPQFVSYNVDGLVETVQYSQLISPMLKALQKQQLEIELLKIENSRLNKDNLKLKTSIEEINQLKAEIQTIKSVLNISSK